MNLSYKKEINIITMKIALYFSALAVLLGACSSSQNFTRAQEDDIYYVPGKRSLFAQEIKDKTGVDITSNTSSSSQISKNTNNDKVYPKEIDNSVNPKSHSIGMARYATEKQVQKEETRTGQTVNRIAVPADDGYWIGGFKGSENDLEECVRIMNRYPEGFAYFGNGYEIAQNLSFSSDWNVYTIDGRYWWFPSSSNVGLYSQLIFGNYPKYIWTVIWNDPRFDSFAWSNNVSFGWNRWGWGASFGWGNSWGWDPYWNNYYGYGYNPWGWGHGFYDPWSWNPYWNHYYGYHPHWGHRPGHGHHGPNWGNHRPDWGGASKPTVTTRYAPKKQYTTNRNARSYSTYSRTSRSSAIQSRSNSSRYESGSNYNPLRNNSSNSSGSYSRGNSGSSSYGSSSTTRSSSGGSGPVQRTNSGSRR